LKRKGESNSKYKLVRGVTSSGEKAWGKKDEGGGVKTPGKEGLWQGRMVHFSEGNKKMGISRKVACLNKEGKTSRERKRGSHLGKLPGDSLGPMLTWYLKKVVFWKIANVKNKNR